MCVALDSSSIARPQTPPTSSAKAQLTPNRYHALIRPLPDSPSKVQSSKPSWWNDAYQLIKSAYVSNKEYIIGSDSIEYKSISELGDKLIKENNPIEMLMFLKLLSEKIFFGSNILFFKVLKRLREDSNINRFFADVSEEPEKEGPSLSTDGINAMFDFFVEEFHFMRNSLTAQKLSNLHHLVSVALDSPDNSRCGWAIYNDIGDENGHVVPIFVVKKRGELNLFVFDSLGHIISKGECPKIDSPDIQNLIDNFKEIESGRLSIYSYKCRRQHCPIGCAIFAIHDLKQLMERDNKKSIVDFYSQFPLRMLNRDLHVNDNLPIYEIEILPPEMMKVSQSIKEIETYISESSALSSITSPRSTSSGEIVPKKQDAFSLKESLSKCQCVYSKDVKRNLYFEKKRMTDIVLILSRHFISSRLIPIPKYFPKVLFPQYTQTT